MNKDKGFRGFIRTSRAYYAKAFSNENTNVMVGIYHEGGGTSGEFEFEWVPLGDREVVRIKAFNDSWAILIIPP